MHFLATLMGVVGLAISPEKLASERPSLVIESENARLVVDVRGGSVGDFRFKDSELNPLNWATPSAGDVSIRGFGHFLCLDRWGPPSAAEGAKGMPYHGEAAHVEWQIVSGAARRDGLIEAHMAATLPMAGLSVRRTILFSSKEAVFTMLEEVTNENTIGRIYNMVQHPTIGPPFLDESTIVDCAGRKGFAQGGSLPDPEEPSFIWPRALDPGGKTVDMRRLTDDPIPNVVSYTLDGKYGWVTAATPKKGVLIGYLWKTTDYPWVSLWRDVHEGKPAARGLEFGTTGLHQPYPTLVQKGRIWDHPLFEFLDAGETARKRYTAFLFKVPENFTGVESIQVAHGRLVLHERGGTQTRDLAMDALGVIPD